LLLGAQARFHGDRVNRLVCLLFEDTEFGSLPGIISKENAPEQATDRFFFFFFFLFLFSFSCKMHRNIRHIKQTSLSRD